MYILYTDGKFEYASEDSVLTYTPLQLSNSQSLAIYNGQISTVSVISGDAGRGLNMSNHYVLTIELSGIIFGPCTFKLYLQPQNYNNYYNITKIYNIYSIQPFSLTIPIYNKLSWFAITFHNHDGYNILNAETAFVRATYIES